jgi:hypothetical protein
VNRLKQHFRHSVYRHLPGWQGSGRRRDQNQWRQRSEEAGAVVSESAPVVSATNARVGWVAGGREIGTKETNPWQVVAYAICAEL